MAQDVSHIPGKLKYSKLILLRGQAYSNIRRKSHKKLAATLMSSSYVQDKDSAKEEIIINHH